MKREMESTLKSGIIWNVIGFGLTAVMGIIINIVVVIYGNSAILGIYNQLTAYYAVLGQVAAFGMQQLGVFFVTNAQDPKEEHQLIGSMLLCSLIAGLVTAYAMYLLANPLNEIFYHNRAMLAGLRAVAVAAVPFGINKCILGILNAYQQMKKYAVLQMAKYAIILLVVLISVCTNQFYQYGVYCFLIAEIAIIIFAVILAGRKVKIGAPQISMLKKCFAFGGKALAGGVVNQLNTRVDILVLGIFCTSEIVGTYSFAAMLAEGVIGILSLVRANINPIFAELLKGKKTAELCEWNKRLEKSRIFAFIFQIVIIAGYIVLCYIINELSYLDGLIPLAILLTAISISVPQIIKGNIMTLSGKPQTDTIITVQMLLVNVIINIILVQWYQMTGVAIATAISYMAYMFLVEYAIRKWQIMEEKPR